MIETVSRIRCQIVRAEGHVDEGGAIDRTAPTRKNQEENMSKWRTTAAVVAATVLAAPALAASYDEGIDGDLSDDRLNPTDLGALSLGSNTVTATSVQNDREYYTFEVPAGWTLDSLIVSAFSGDDIAFVGVQSGTQFTEPASGTDVSALLGYSHFGDGVGLGAGQDILDDIGQGAGSQGFTPPLGAGDYVWWSQETGTTPVNYTLDFVVSPTPSAACLLAGCAALGVVRRRR